MTGMIHGAGRAVKRGRAALWGVAAFMALWGTETVFRYLVFGAAPEDPDLTIPASYIALGGIAGFTLGASDRGYLRILRISLPTSILLMGIVARRLDLSMESLVFPLILLVLLILPYLLLLPVHRLSKGKIEDRMIPGIVAGISGLILSLLAIHLSIPMAPAIAAASAALVIVSLPRVKEGRIGTAVAAAVILTGAVLSIPPGAVAVEERPLPRSSSEPSAVIFVYDALRADHLFPYGYSRHTAPNLEALARDGVVFEHALAPAQTTYISLPSFFLGQLPARHGFGFRDLVGPYGGEGIFARFRRSGYRTAAVVWEPGMPWYGLRNSEFDIFIDRPWGATRGTRAIRSGWALTALVDLAAGGGKDLKEAWLSDVGETLDGLLRSDEPFVLYVHDPRTHAPHVSRLSGIEPFSNLDEVSAWRLNDRMLAAASGGPPLTNEEISGMNDLYDDEIMVADETLGLILGMIEEAGMTDSVVIIATSDHGEGLGDGEYFHPEGSLARGVFHVPLIVRATGIPGVHPARVGEAVSGIDIGPTLAAMAGVSLEGLRVDGSSFLPLMRDMTEPARTAVFGAEGGFVIADSAAILTVSGGETRLSYWEIAPLDSERTTENPERAAGLLAELEERLP